MIERWLFDKYPDPMPPIGHFILGPTWFVLIVCLLPFSILMWVMGYKNCYHCHKPIPFWGEYDHEYGYCSSDGQDVWRIHHECKAVEQGTNKSGFVMSGREITKSEYNRLFGISSPAPVATKGEGSIILHKEG